MRLLKPEIEEIQKKFGEEKKLESQQAVMALYKKAGVNPLGGCLPMLFQMPILISMFYFFPISIELRQQSFSILNGLVCNLIFVDTQHQRSPAILCTKVATTLLLS